MSKKLKVKVGLLIVAVVASTLVMGLLLNSRQLALTLQSYDAEMNQEEPQLMELLAQAEEQEAENTETYDGVYQAKAASVAYLATHNTGYEATRAKMVEYRDLLGVDNVIVCDADGNIVAQAGSTKADFTHARFNQLREVFSTGEPSEPVEVELPDEDWLARYYAAAIDDETMVVVEQDPTELRELNEATGSVASVLADVTVGSDGYVFAVSDTDYLVTYHPDEALIGTDAIDDGLNVADLEDGNRCWMTLDGESLYCGVVHPEGTYYIFAIPEASMASSRYITVNVIVFVFLAVASACALYGVFVMHDDEKSGQSELETIGHGVFRLNRAVSGKAAALAFVGLVAVVAVSFYMQTLFAVSSESVTASDRAEAVAETIQRAEEREAELEEQYADRYLSKARVAAYAVEKNPELADRAALQELADALDVRNIFTFDGDGVMTATNSSYSHFTLSEDPEDQSYAFRRLLQGVEYYVQEAMPDEISGDLWQYIGVTLYTEDGEADGFVQLGIRPTRLEELLASVQIDAVLDGVKVGTEGFAFAVNKEDGTIAYYPEERLIGKTTEEVGIEDRALKGGFTDYLTVDGKTYYAASVEQGDYYIYVAAPDGELMAERLPLTIDTGLVAAVCLAVVYAIVALEPAGAAAAAGVGEEGAEAADADGPRTFEVELPDGRTTVTESAASRWLNRSFAWDERTPEQKLALVLRVFAGFAVIVVFVAVLMRDTIFPDGSVFAYILSGDWERGLNVFAFTASLFGVCVAVTLVAVVTELLRLVSSALSARGETVCRLIASFAKYATVIGMVYWVLLLFGSDATTLLASAGLLTLAVSLGAQQLVADILSGLFIIFEGEFRVGDVIQVGSNKGTVMDIGVRTTKINDGSGNILVLRNSNISNVVNMTKELSVASIEVGIEYGESLERVENILAVELPKMAEKFPAIIEGPFYKGVSSLADNSVNIKITAKCKEGDRGGIVGDLTREMKLLFDKYDISIPYPQIVVNKPVEFKKATQAEKDSAQRFTDEQKAASAGIGGNEDEDFDPSNDSRRH